MEPIYKGEPRTAGEAFTNFSQTEIRLQRRIDSTDRLYRRALDELRQLQKERPGAPSGTVESAVETTVKPMESVAERAPDPESDFVSSLPEMDPVARPPAPAPGPEKRRLTISQMRELMERKLKEDDPDWKPAA